MTEQVELTQSASGEANILCQGKPLYSRYAPSAAAEKGVQQIPLQENCIYIIPSPLLGYGISSFKDLLPSSSLILGIETDQSLMAVCAPYLGALEDECFSAWRVDAGASLYEVFKGVIEQGKHFRHCRLVPLNSGYQLNKGLYDALF
ncbi:MAG: hypothetical protein PQJ58_18425, partial [Spirochaetales bacterium]|nr:hypothetical protein [Spirochaetales bacterium]